MPLSNLDQIIKKNVEDVLGVSDPEQVYLLTVGIENDMLAAQRVGFRITATSRNLLIRPVSTLPIQVTQESTPIYDNLVLERLLG